MKTSIKSFVSLSAIYFLTSGLAIAEPADVIIGDTSCTLATEVNGYPSVFVEGVRHKVTSNSENGNISVTCSQDLKPTSTGRSVIFNFDFPEGARCGVRDEVDPTIIYYTEDWHQIISRSGKAKLVCIYHN